MKVTKLSKVTSPWVKTLNIATFLEHQPFPYPPALPCLSSTSHLREDWRVRKKLNFPPVLIQIPSNLDPPLWGPQLTFFFHLLIISKWRNKSLMCTSFTQIYASIKLYLIKLTCQQRSFYVWEPANQCVLFVDYIMDLTQQANLTNVPFYTMCILFWIYVIFNTSDFTECSLFWVFFFF